LACTGGKKSPPPACAKNGRLGACAGVADAVLELFSAVALLDPTRHSPESLPVSSVPEFESFSRREKVPAGG